MNIRADVNFHAEAPLIALHGLVHLGVASLDMVLGRSCGMNDRGLEHGAYPLTVGLAVTELRRSRS